MKAYVLLNAESAEMENVLHRLEGAPSIVSVEAVSGPFDLIAVVEVETLPDLSRLIARELQAVPGVVRTMTCVVLPL